MKPIILSLFNHPLLKPLANNLKLDIGQVTFREFPDGETYIRLQDNLQDREVIILESLDRPNQKILPLLFLAQTAKALGAKMVGLCVPYLAYMRQDKQFHPGEGVTSEYFAALLSHYFDWIVTVDPHLHRHHQLSEIYSIPNSVLQAAPLISSWIKTNINAPVLIGPDSESEQWVSAIAKTAEAPYLILEKIRYDDRNVEVSVPEIQPFLKNTPVLIDDIISTAQTMLKTIYHLKMIKMKVPVCIGVHAVFAGDAYKTLLKSGVEKVVTCNSIPHASNKIDLSTLISRGIQQQLGGV